MGPRVEYCAKSAKNECMNDYFANRSITGDDRTEVYIMHIVGLYLMMNYPFPPSHE